MNTTDPTLTVVSTDSSNVSVEQKVDATQKIKRKYNRRKKNATEPQTNPSLGSAESIQRSPPKRNVRNQNRIRPGKTKRDTETLSLPLSNSDVSPASKTKKQNAGRKKKVRFAKYCQNIEESTPAPQLDFIPMIKDSCKKHIKHILSTAVQFQRHSHRQILTEADFVRALAFHKDFKIESEDCNDK